MFQFSAMAKRALTLASLTILASVSSMAFAQSAWPTKPVTVVVPFSAGGSTDVIARLLAKELGKAWGQSVIVDNRAGAGGNIGTALVAKAQPDGYTLLLASGSIFTVNPFLYAKLPFDPQKDFMPITNIASGPMVVVIPASGPGSQVGSLRELIAKAKANPGKLNFGSAGNGSQVHMAGEKFADAAKIDVQHVPYKGEAPSYVDLMAGQLDFVVGNIGATSSLIADGRLKALAVTGKERSKLLPNVPTVAESGLPAAENYGWFGFFAPAGTPKEIVDKVWRDTTKALASSEIKDRLASLGMAPVGNQPAEFTKAIAQESESWRVVVKNRKLTAN